MNKIIIRVNEFYKAVFTIDDSEFCIISQLKEHVPFSFFVFILYINIFGENELDEPVVITFSTVVFFFSAETHKTEVLLGFCCRFVIFWCIFTGTATLIYIRK